MESTECGTAKALFSLVRAAAVTCAIMNPEFNPGSGVSDAGAWIEFGIHDCAGDGGGSYEREQGLGCAAFRGFHFHERQSGRLRLDGNERGATAGAHVGEFAKYGRYRIALRLPGD